MDNKAKIFHLYAEGRNLTGSLFFVSEKKQEQMCDHIDRKVSM